MTWLLLISVFASLGSYFVDRSYVKKPSKTVRIPGDIVRGALVGHVSGASVGMLYGMLWEKSELGWANSGVIVFSIVLPLMVYSGNLVIYSLKHFLEVSTSRKFIIANLHNLNFYGLHIFTIPLALPLALMIHEWLR